MTIMEEREQKNNNYWSNKMALSEAFFSIVDTIRSRSKIISGSPGSILAKDAPALAVSGKREQRVL
jgi:hypothetical protein